MVKLEQVEVEEVTEIEEVEVDQESEANVSKSELKARKALAKLGLKLVPDVSRVVIRRANNSLFVINEPDVFKTANGDTHIVFGNAKIEEALTQQEAAAKLMGSDVQVSSEAPEKSNAGNTEEEAQEDDDDVDADGIEETDIEMVMSQANVSRGKAVKALKANDLDIVNAIMELNVAE